MKFIVILCFAISETLCLRLVGKFGVNFNYERNFSFGINDDSNSCDSIYDEPGKCKSEDECHDMWSDVPLKLEATSEGCALFGTYCCVIPSRSVIDRILLRQGHIYYTDSRGPTIHREKPKQIPPGNEEDEDFKLKNRQPSSYPGEGTPCAVIYRGFGKCTTIKECEKIWNGMPRNFSRVYYLECEALNNLICCPTPPGNVFNQEPSETDEDDKDNGRRNQTVNGEIPKATPITVLTSSLAKVMPKDCGGVGDGYRIFGGTETDINEYPWMALLEYERPDGKQEVQCGGSLISDVLVLTAAHCVRGGRLKDFDWRLRSVRLGEWNITSPRDCWTIPATSASKERIQCTESVSIPVKDFVTHEEYDPNSRSVHHDIALLQLARRVEFTDFIKPICLPRSGNLADRLIVAGWGQMNSSRRSDILRKVEVPRANRETCASIYRNIKTELNTGQICYGGDAGKDSCAGDSGGPLMEIRDGRAYLVGIVSLSFSESCGLKDVPSIYVKVFDYILWMDSQIG
ncbi:hypothetical protein QAD02_005668 [Eretmocerus hayati]|uniref:Uncharacterized protein n=1 Tax=Eretmocerus hayati TaxID=131215 RepID=A0ACC2NTE1_9HYME|nr:hypothetical protein QAD02_005668 [Eretmocerus hayati]